MVVLLGSLFPGCRAVGSITYILSPYIRFNISMISLENRGIVWGDESLALVYESWYKTRRTRTWIIAPGTTNSEPRILFDRSSEDVYSDPGSPMLRRTALGTYVLAQLKNSDEKRCLLLNGSGASPEGYVPFLDVFDT